MATPRRQRWTLAYYANGIVSEDPLLIDVASLTAGQVWQAIRATADGATNYVATIYRVDPDTLNRATWEQRKRLAVLRTVAHEGRVWRAIIDRHGRQLACDCVDA